GAGEHRCWEVQAERLGGFQIYDQLVLGGLLNRQVGGLGALKNLVDVGGGTTIEIVGIGAVTHEATRQNVLLKWEHARQAVLERERSEWHALANNQRWPHGQKSPDALLRHRQKHAVEVFEASRLYQPPL